jgi:glyoxylate/hydroxypyruvate reductase A
MALLLICPTTAPEPWVNALKGYASDIDVRVWPDDENREEIEFALTWEHPEGVLQQYPNLKCISSMGAGIDHFLTDRRFPSGVPVVRIVDPELIQSMSEYVVAVTLSYFRQFDTYRERQLKRSWRQEPAPRARKICVGIMGLGRLGGDAALKLKALGFRLIGWTRSPKDLEGVETFVGDAQLDNFLSMANILICLLPLTSKTKDILNRNTFLKLPQGAYVINVGRGQHLVEEDLLQALDSGHLAGACLDVFREEPLPPDHPFWSHPKVFVTPHISSITDPVSVAPQVIENYNRARSGASLLYAIELEREY